VKLEVGDVTETVTVEANGVRVNPAQTTLEGIVTRELITALPLNGRNFLDLGQLEPGAQLNQSPFVPKAAYSMLAVAAQSGVTTRVTVDGLDISDEHLGTVAQNISQDSVQEYQVSRSTADVTTGVTGSGAVNIVTKGGSKDLRGSTYFFWRDDALAARVGQEPLPFDREQFGFNLGGPILRNRLFWFLSYERNNQDAVTATNIPGLPQFTQTWPLPFDERMASARLDWNITSSLRLFSRFTHNWNDGISNRSLGGGNLTPRADSNNANQVAVGLDAAAARFTHSVRFGYMNYDNFDDIAPERIPGIPETLDPAGRPLRVDFGNPPVGVIGPADNTPTNRLHDNTEIRYDGGFSFGRHSLRWGGGVNRIRVNWFASISGHAPAIRLRFDAAAQTVCGSDVHCYPVVGGTVSNQQGFWTDEPSHGLPYGGARNGRVHWYVADSWRVNQRFNLNLGLRWVYEPGPGNPNFSKPAILEDFLLGSSGHNRLDKNNLAPQLGLAWDPTGKAKWVVRAGAGVFYDNNLLKHVIFERSQHIPLGITQENVNLANQLVRDPVTNAVIFDLSGRNTSALITPGVNWLGRPLGTPGLIDAVIAAQQAFQAAYQVAFANFPSGPTRCELRRSGCQTFGPYYATPYSFQFNVGIQRELRPGLVLSVDYVRHRGVHLHSIRDFNLNGAASTLSVTNAQAAMNATFARFSSGGVRCDNSTAFPTLAARVDCTIAAGARIGSYAAQGLGFFNGATNLQPNFSAFPGLNPSFNKMAWHTMSGLSTYNALQMHLRGRLPNLRQGVRDWTVVASYALSRLEVAGAFEDAAVLNFGDHHFHNDPLKFRGPSTLDRTHMLSVGNLFTIPGGVRLNSIWRAFSALPQTVFLSQVSGGAAEIFQTDLNGDSVGGDPLPGTNRGSYGRKIGCGAAALNRVIDAYNSTQAGSLTPAGEVLVNAGLFTTTQLQQLGAVSPSVPRAPDGQVCLDSFITTDVRIARPFKLRGERVTIEPAFEWFNLFNVANYDLSNNKLRGVLSGAAGSVNGTTAANRTNRAEFSGGSFALGTPRSWQLALRVSF
jgi:hypothetical protein